MPRFLLTLSLLVALLTACSARPTPTPIEVTATPAPPIFRIVAYATDGIVESIIPYDKLTHINYSFLTPKDDGTFNLINNDWKLRDIVKSARQNDVKVLISVGGWGWDKQFETVAVDPQLRSAFVQNLKTFVDDFNLDGADIDWEYPDAGESAQHFLALIQELRAAMPEKLLTAAAVSYGENAMGILPETFDIFDFLNIMTYDGPDHGTMAQFEKGLSFWTARGLPKEKIVMGIPFYGDPDMPYRKLVQNDSAAAQMDTYDFFGSVYHYNGIPTVQAKTKLAMQQANGIMFWTLDFDIQGEFSLVNAIYQTSHP